jgi:MoxR-like ATPase
VAIKEFFKRVSSAPTNPSRASAARSFDVADLYRGPVAERQAAVDAQGLPLDEKLRQAYFWIVNTAIISPHYDIEYNDTPPAAFTLGDSKSRLTLPTAQSYSSYVLLPLLTFATRRKCLFIGGPGRGKTASAILMGVLAGYSVALNSKPFTNESWSVAPCPGCSCRVQSRLGSRWSRARWASTLSLRREP